MTSLLSNFNQRIQAFNEHIEHSVQSLAQGNLKCSVKRPKKPS
jgi:hypothetical protein